MRTIAVIIPYFQREAGILGRALRSAYAQDVEQASIRILVIDDASPFDPAKEIEAAGSPPSHITVEIIRRQNGGPGAARNTGFDAAMKFADLIAMLDSDDAWTAGHLRRALASLDAGHDVYFSDHASIEGVAYLPTARIYEHVRNPGPALTPVEGVDRVLGCPSSQMAIWATREYIAHTSSVVYRAAKLGHVRMSELLRSAGEDHLFFLDLLLGSDRVCFSLEPEVILGEGVNIYLSAFEWGAERDLRRRAFNLTSQRLMRDRTAWPADVYRELREGVADSRRTVGFLLLRGLLTGKAKPATLALIWKLDPVAVLMAPLNSIQFAIARDPGKIAGAQAR